MYPAAFCDRHFCIADHNTVAQNRIACRDTAQGYLVGFGNGIDQRKAFVELRPGGSRPSLTMMATLSRAWTWMHKGRNVPLLDM